MLNGISPILSPELLNALYRMGHGDEILLADAHFPGDTFGQRVIRADGLRIPELLEAILPLFPLDTFVEAPLTMMAAVHGDCLDPKVEKDYRLAIAKAGADAETKIERIERFAYYERVKSSYAVVMTGEMAKYGNLILKKGLAHI
ncbi:L-fucose mutarotase [Coraliomargarita parva]|uniref:L-fucose mutarotase n=1 Tax=Coraliomargarita parva TaxID=3014050 RepID=UPI0022B538DC|nr:L-fucose mutarotase [Coraliomargarita parva]